MKAQRGLRYIVTQKRIRSAQCKESVRFVDQLRNGNDYPQIMSLSEPLSCAG